MAWDFSVETELYNQSFHANYPRHHPDLVILDLVVTEAGPWNSQEFSRKNDFFGYMMMECLRMLD
jgi:hypothetical protein